MQRTVLSLTGIGTALVLVFTLLAGDVAMAQGAAAKPKESTKAATPPAKATPAKKSPGWSVRCDNSGKKLQCKAFQNVFMQKTGQLFLSVSVSQPEKEKNKNGAMMLQLPLGLFNPAGVMVSVDVGKAEKLPIQTCEKAGCFAAVPLTAAKIAELMKGKKLTVVFENLQKKKITVGVPLNGFGEAYKKL